LEFATNHRATVRAFFDTWTRQDAEALTEFFAEDGEWSEPHRPILRGRDALLSTFKVQMDFSTDFHVDYRMLAQVSDDCVVAERIDTWKIHGVEITTDSMGVFLFDAEGKITRFRDYFDWSNVEHQLLKAGVDAESLGNARPVDGGLD
jgi:limonene-1,2-epoxide hydrolase